uniref:Sulfatase N-terminal domain-containing protein n=1 Tax=Timema poppense TaxID=170557 RepID=A0A7R9GUP8_TIMPO|nr:unnamed protein product [Timema poppensis]
MIVFLIYENNSQAEFLLTLIIMVELQTTPLELLYKICVQFPPSPPKTEEEVWLAMVVGGLAALLFIYLEPLSYLVVSDFLENTWLIYSPIVIRGVYISDHSPRRPECVKRIQTSKTCLLAVATKGWNDVGFHGSDQIPTPNIDALAYHGVILNRHYTMPTCTPSRTAFLTGKYPIRTGMQGFPIKAGEPRGIPLEERLLPERLAQLGYSTHLVGKWHVGSHRVDYTPTRRGFASHFGYWNGYIGYFDHNIQQGDGIVIFHHGRNYSLKGLFFRPISYYSSPVASLVLTDSSQLTSDSQHLGRGDTEIGRGMETGGGGVERHMKTVGGTSREKEGAKNEGWTWNRSTPVRRPEFRGLDLHRDLDPALENKGQYATDVFTREAVDIILSHDKARPLYLQVAHLAVHSGNDTLRLEVPDVNANDRRFSYITNPRRRLFAGMLARLDESVGKIVEAMAERGILDNSILVFLSDNGAQTFGLHTNEGSNWPLRGTAEDWEIEVRSQLGALTVVFLKLKERFGNQIHLCQDRGLNPGHPAQKSNTLPLDRQVTKRGLGTTSSTLMGAIDVPKPCSDKRDVTTVVWEALNQPLIE